jgi:alpha-L-fucosidase
VQNLQALTLPDEKKAWFVHDRFGLFVHWGLYALPARHEWVKSREELSDADYQNYFDHSIRIFTIPATGPGAPAPQA